MKQKHKGKGKSPNLKEIFTIGSSWSSAKLLKM